MSRHQLVGAQHATTKTAAAAADEDSFMKPAFMLFILKSLSLAEFYQRSKF